MLNQPAITGYSKKELNILGKSRVFSNILEDYVPFQNTVTLFYSSWKILVYQKAFWNLLELSGPFGPHEHSISASFTGFSQKDYDALLLLIPLTSNPTIHFQIKTFIDSESRPTVPFKLIRGTGNGLQSYSRSHGQIAITFILGIYKFIYNNNLRSKQNNLKSKNN